MYYYTLGVIFTFPLKTHLFKIKNSRSNHFTVKKPLPLMENLASHIFFFYTMKLEILFIETEIRIPLYNVIRFWIRIKRNEAFGYWRVIRKKDPGMANIYKICEHRKNTIFYFEVLKIGFAVGCKMLPHMEIHCSL